VYPNPDCNLTCTPDDCSACFGESVTVTEDGGDAVSWNWSASTAGGSGTGDTFTATSSGTVSVTITDANGCTSTCQTEVTIYDGPTASAGPDQTIISGGSVQIGGSPTASDGTPPYTYFWEPDNGTLSDTSAANPTASPDNATTYTVTVTDENGCTDSDSMTVEITPPPPPPPLVRGRLSCPSCSLEIDMLGEIAEIDIGCCSNQTLHNYEPSDPDDLHFLLIDSATAVICGETDDCGNYPKIIVMREAEDSEEAPGNGVFVGPVYDFTGYEWSNWEDPDCPKCDTVTFGRAVSALIGYDPDDLPEGTVMVGLYVFDPGLGEWVLSKPMPGVVAGVGQANGLVNHFSQLAVIAELPAPTPHETPPTTTTPPPSPTASANFIAQNLEITPGKQVTGAGVAVFRVEAGESVTITANVINNGGAEGSYIARLELNGETLASQEISLQPGQSKQVVFVVTDNAPGRYVVQIGDLSGEFESVSWTNWWLIGGLIAGVTLLAWYYGYYRRRHLRPPG